MTVYRPFDPAVDPEPEPEDICDIEAMGCTWKLPWAQVAEDVKSGFAIMWLEV